MFTTPLRSENMPPRAAKISGVAKRSMEAVSADHTTTDSRLDTLDSVAIVPSAPKMTAMPRAM